MKEGTVLYCKNKFSHCRPQNLHAIKIFPLMSHDNGAPDTIRSIGRVSTSNTNTKYFPGVTATRLLDFNEFFTLGN